jgi:hypothetical protein
VVFTAVFFSYPKANDWLYSAFGETPPPRPGAAGPAREGSQGRDAGRGRDGGARRDAGSGTRPAGEAMAMASLSAAWKRAEEQMPGWQSISLRIPSSATAPLVFTIDRGNGARPDLRGQLTLDPKNGGIDKWEPYQSNSPARKVRLWVRWLHTGEAGGWIGQTIAGLASAAGAVLVWTGVSLALRRLFRRKARLASKSEIEQPVAA